MTPKELKDLCIKAAKENDHNLAFSLVQIIVNEDYYINVPTNKVKGGEPRIVKVQWGDKPCQARCDLGLIPEGSEAWWIKGRGVWHMECWNVT